MDPERLGSAGRPRTQLIERLFAHVPQRVEKIQLGLDAIELERTLPRHEAELLGATTSRVGGDSDRLQRILWWGTALADLPAGADGRRAQREAGSTSRSRCSTASSTTALAAFPPLRARSHRIGCAPGWRYRTVARRRADGTSSRARAAGAPLRRRAGRRGPTVTNRTGPRRAARRSARVDVPERAPSRGRPVPRKDAPRRVHRRTRRRARVDRSSLPLALGFPLALGRLARHRGGPQASAQTRSSDGQVRLWVAQLPVCAVPSCWPPVPWRTSAQPLVSSAHSSRLSTQRRSWVPETFRRTVAFQRELLA